MKTSLPLPAVFALLMVPAPPAGAANPPAAKLIESQRRMDPTGSGSYHRTGLLRELETTRRNLAKKQKASLAEKKVRG